MNKNRPVNLDLGSLKYPPMAIASILHRLSGLLMFVLLPFMLCYLGMSLRSLESFEALRVQLMNPWTKLVFWAFSSAWAYHNVTSLTGNGLKDWWIQRATAAYFLVYSLFLFIFLIGHCHLDYVQWQELFHHAGFKVATVIALLALMLHSWIGIWTVTTDYLKCTVLRFSLQLAVMLLLLGQFIYGLMIVWGQ